MPVIGDLSSSTGICRFVIVHILYLLVIIFKYEDGQGERVAMTKARITYRFDQNGRAELKQERQHLLETTMQNEDAKMVPLYEEEYKVLPEEKSDAAKMDVTMDPKHDTQYLNQFTTDFGAWSSPFDAETEKLERLIRSSEPKIGGTGTDKHAGDHFYRSGPSIPEKDTSFPKVVRYSKTRWSTVTSAFIGAVITGIVFGFFVLTFFNDNIPPSDLTIGSNLIQGEPPIVMLPDGELTETIEGMEQANTNGTEAQNYSAVEVNLPAQTYYLLQNGVFTHDEGAKMALSDLTSSGFNGTAMTRDHIYVYAGVVNDRDAALSLSHELQTHHFEIYIKQFDIAPVRQVRWNAANAERIEAYMKQSNDLAKTLINVSILQLQKEMPSALEQTSMQMLSQLHQSVIDASAGLAEGLGDEAQIVFNKMNGALNTAIVSMEEYNRNPAYSYQWQAQAALTEFVLLQEELLRQIAI